MLPEGTIVMKADSPSLACVWSERHADNKSNEQDCEREQNVAKLCSTTRSSYCDTLTSGRYRSPICTQCAMPPLPSSISTASTVRPDCPRRCMCVADCVFVMTLMTPAACCQKVLRPWQHRGSCYEASCLCRVLRTRWREGLLATSRGAPPCPGYALGSVSHTAGLSLAAAERWACRPAAGPDPALAPPIRPAR